MLGTMSKRTHIMTLSALYVALTVISLYIASVWPTGLFGLVAFASLFCAATVIDAGIAFGLYVYIISSVIGILLLPNKAAPLLYIFFFGYYPVVKSLIERIHAIIMQWAAKLLVFNSSFTIIWSLFRSIIFNIDDNPLYLILLYLGGNFVFVVYDYGFTKIIWLYINRISKHIRRFIK